MLLGSLGQPERTVRPKGWPGAAYSLMFVAVLASKLASGLLGELSGWWAGE